MSVADDGGSSGRLRQVAGIPAPGRPAPLPGRPGGPDSPWAEAFEYRFPTGRPRRPRPRQPGHRRPGRRAPATSATPSTMAAACSGRRGRVLPATSVPVGAQGRRGRAPRWWARSTWSRSRGRRSQAVSLVPARRRRARRRSLDAIAGRRPGGHRSRLALHQRAGRRAWCPRSGPPWPAGREAGSTSATSGPSCRRRPATTPPTTSAPSCDHGVEVDMVIDDPPRHADRYSGRAGRRQRLWAGPMAWPRSRTAGRRAPADWRIVDPNRLTHSSDSAGTDGVTDDPIECRQDRATMAVRVGINGFGRIGRNFVRAALEQAGADVGVVVVGVNDLVPAATNAHLLKYDSTHGSAGRRGQRRPRRSITVGRPDASRSSPSATQGPALGRPRRRRGHRVDRDLHRRAEGGGPHRGRRAAGDHLGAGDQRRRHLRRSASTTTPSTRPSTRSCPTPRARPTASCR